MNSAATSEDEIRDRGFAILRRELGRGEFARFLRSLYKNRGDYTAERESWISSQSLEQVEGRIEKQREGGIE